MKKIIWATLALFLSTKTQAQSYKIPVTPVLKHLYFSKNDINSVSNTNQNSILPEFINRTKTNQKIVKTKTGLYLTIDGTGKVFKAIEIDSTSIRFDRIDTTTYFGNTFYSIDFSYNDTLFSFGGYGFWHMNGQLRRFSSTREWSIEKISNLRHTTNYVHNYIPKNHKLYYIEQPINDEETVLQKEGFTAIEFDIKKKSNKLLGQVNSNINLGFNIMIDLPNLNGTLINSDRNFLLLDFEHNKVFKLKNKYLIDALLDKSGTTLQNTFEENGRIYYTNYPDTSLKSIPVTIKDFEVEPYSLYEQPFENRPYFIIVICLFLISISTTLYLALRRRRSNKTNLHKHEVISINDTFSNDFTTIERTLIENLIDKCNNGSYFTVDDINTYLGTKKKPVEIQKTIRTEAINRINHKFIVNCNTNTPLLQRIRSTDDARFMNYIINKHNIELYTKYITNNGR